MKQLNGSARMALKRMLIGCVGLMIALAMGCVSTFTPKGYELTVSNNSDAKVKDVEVVLDGSLAFRAAQLKPRELMADPIQLRGSGPQETIIRWKTENGDAQEKIFSPEKPLPKRFDGRLDMEFKSDKDVAMYSDLKENKEGSVLPWATPEEWEGAPSIPGLGGQGRN